MMTAHGTVDKAVEAMQKGAYSYILKPFENERLILYVKKATAVYEVMKDNRRLRDDMESRYSFGNLIGKSKCMQDVFTTIKKVARSTATVLIEGESGTGKELVAKSIHFNSPRRDRPFIAVNCCALTESLLESELFGHEKGSFTGAVAMKKGRFELADNGTLFLDEIGELPQNLQVKLLRVLQEKTIERVGGGKPITVNIRVLVATNKNLKQEVQKGRFREDLFFRLNVVNLILPPLRKRPEDLQILTKHFIAKYTDKLGIDMPGKTVDKDVERFFHSYRWPGNVRELENVIERALIMCPGNTITISDLPRDLKDGIQYKILEEIPGNAKLYETLSAIEKKMILRSLKITNNVQSHAAALLGIGKSGLNQKIKKYNLKITAE